MILNNKFAAIVTVRSTSSRLEKKCFQPLFEDISMIQIVIRRAKKIGCQVILATSEDASDDNLVEIAKSENVLYFRGSLKNKIHRWHQCFLKYSLDYGVLIDADDPSFSFTVAKRALIQLKKNKSEIITGSKDLMPGLITYGLSAGGMSKLFSVATDYDLDTDVIEMFVQQSNLTNSTIHPIKGERVSPKIRLTIDYQEDLLFYRALFEEISYLDESSNLIKKIIELKISTINWFRNEEFIKNQFSFNEGVNFEK
jgi:spore coat polysaccharide biosynthesis protein SpsF